MSAFSPHTSCTAAPDLLEFGVWITRRPIWLAAAVIAVACGWIAAGAAVAGWRHRNHARDARVLTIAPPPQADPCAAADWWRTMAGALTPSWWRRLVYGTPHVVFEYRWAGRILTVQLWIPGTVPAAAVQAAIRSAWPGATIADTQPAAALVPAAGSMVTGGRLHLRHPQLLPLRTDHDSDPVRPLLAAGAETRPGEHTLVQVLARPAARRRLAAARKSITANKTGAQPFTASHPAAWAAGAAARAIAQLLVWLVELLLPGPRRTTPAAALRPPSRLDGDPVAARDTRSMVDKLIGGAVYEVDVRYLVAAMPRAAAPDREEIARLRQRLRGLAHAVASAFAAHTGRNSLRRRKLAHPLTVTQVRRMGRGFLAGVDELAVLAALPTDVVVPGLDRARAKTVPPHVLVPSGGPGVKPLGTAHQPAIKVGLPVASMAQHIHLIGKTGTGKSTLLTHLVLDDVLHRRGAVVIDPRGDLVLDILNRLPADAADRTVVIDPDQDGYACINPLDGDDPHLAVDNIISIFGKIFARYWGPRIDDVMRVALLTLLNKHPGSATLSLVPPLLNSDQFRAEYTAGLDDPAGLHGFWVWYDSMPPQARAQIIGPVQARLRHFLLRDFVRHTIGQPKSSIDLGKVLDGGLLLCRLPKGQLGEDTTRVLGSLILARTWQTATARASIPEQRRRPAHVYLDEAHNFLNLPTGVADMLAEARGYKLGLILAHQDLSQLPKEVAAGLSANARNKIVFNVDPDDAKTLAKHTLPEVDEHDLSHLDAHTAVARIIVNHRELPAFTFTTAPPRPADGAPTVVRAAVAAAHSLQESSPQERQALHVVTAEQQRKTRHRAKS